MALGDDVRTALQNASLVDGSTGWTSYIGFLQDQPDRAVCIYETGGEVPEEGWGLDRPHFQIRVRGTKDDYQAARDKEHAIFLALHAGETALGSPPYVYCYAIQSGPIPMGQDQNRRPSLVRNYRVAVARS